MPPSIRPATLQDLDAIVQFMREYYAFDNLVFDETIARRAVSEVLGDDRWGVVWLVCVDAVPVGYAFTAVVHSFEFHGRLAYLDEFYIREAHRGKGLARFAVTFLLDECRRRGYDAMRLEVELANTHAQGVYERLGFLKHERCIMTRWV